MFFWAINSLIFAPVIQHSKNTVASVNNRPSSSLDISLLEGGKNVISFALANVFSVEDQRLTKLQLKISIETLIRRGRHAYESHMLGSARQYYEKALRTIEDQSFSDDYTTSRQQSIKKALEQIAQELKDAHTRDKEKHKKEDDLEELFQPKRKW